MKGREVRLTTLINSKLGTGLALWLSRSLPGWLGYPVSRLAADLLSGRSRSSQVRALRANLWVVSGGQATREQLDQWVKQSYRNSARAIYDFYHHLRDHQRVLNLVEVDPSFEEVIEIARSKRAGQVLVVPHVSNFDLVGRAAALRGLQMQVISAPNPPGGYQWQNAIREEVGIEITPASNEALRRALTNLRAGGTVLTGLDRPFDGSKYRLKFFGRLAALPVVHIQLALRTKLPVTVIGGAMKADHTYRVWALPPIAMKEMPDHEAEIVYNAEAVLSAAEEVVRQDPQQWNMTQPVWPEAMQMAP